MNNALTKNTLSAKTLKEIFNAAKFCQQVFVNRDSKNLEICVDQLNKLVTQGLRQNPLLTRLSLNLVHNKFGYYTNLIVKVAVATHWFARKLKFNDEASASMAKTNLCILYVLTQPILQTRNTPAAIKKYKSYLDRGAQLAFKKVSKGVISDQNSLRLLSQLAGINQFSQTNQRAQSLCSAALNCALHALPFLSGRKLSFEMALEQVQLGSLYVLKRPFLQQTLYEIKTQIHDESRQGCLVKLKDNKFAILISCLEQKDECVVFEFAENKISSNGKVESRPNKDLRLIIPQQTTDLFIIVQLYISHQNELFSTIEAESMPVKLMLEQEIMAPKGMEETLDLLSANNNNQLVAKLNQKPEQCQFILNYATKNNRQKLPVSDIKHAIALLGLARVFPAICDSMLNAIVTQDRYIGSAEVVNKLDLFVDLMGILSKTTKVDVPEYCQFTSRLMFIALILIPKSRYALNGKFSPPKSYSASLADLFTPAISGSWQNVCKKLYENWQLPKLYKAAIKAYFDYINGKVSLNKLPRTSQKLVALIEVQVWLYSLVLSGQTDLKPISQTKNSLNILGLSLSELKELYEKLLSEITFVSQLD